MANNKTKSKQENPTKTRKTKDIRKIVNRILVVLIAGAMLIGISGFFMISTIVGKVIKENITDKILNQEPSPVLADDGTKFAEYGGISRENITYDQLPQSVVDAFLSIEDSRYYSHDGFDFPRFISSALTNLKSGSFAQGGSTLTMQLIDNSITKPEEERMKAKGKEYTSVEKVEKKIQEIYLAMKLESELTKEDVMVKYLNEINFGSSANGIQKGAQYYFGKDVSELNISESAFLAGVINAPNYYNPYNGGEYYTRALNRRNKTLEMMAYHGYISDSEYKSAKSISLAQQLNNTSSNTNSEKYKSALLQLQNEVQALTGKDPATTQMTIYTSINLDAQDQANAISSGQATTLPDNQYYQFGFTSLNNANGEIVAVSGGRTDLEVNASEIRTRYNDPFQIGSTSKPLIDYVRAFDDLGWCTSRVMTDNGSYKLDNKISISNADGKAYGDVSLEEAISRSLNTIALQTMEAYLDEKGSDAMIEYLKNLGLSDEVAEGFNIQYAVGGSTLQFSPTQLAAAYAAFANGGYYIKPHMVRKVVMEDGTTYESEVQKTQVMSEAAAFMTSDLLYEAVNGQYKGWNLMGNLGFGSYPVYGKTGTTNYDDSQQEYGGMMKDEWMVNYTSEYTIATWSGFDNVVLGAKTAINYYLYDNVNGHINKIMLDTLTTSNAKKVAKPSTVSEYGGGYIKTEFLKNAGKINPKTISSTTTASDDLQSLVNSASSYNADDYTSESFQAFTKALKAAQKVLANKDASDEEINAAIQALQSAINGLVKKTTVDFTQLTQLIETAKTYVDTSKYSAQSIEALQTAISNGKIVNANSKSTQAEIDASILAINNAIQSCIDNPLITTPPSGETDDGDDSETGGGTGGA